MKALVVFFTTTFLITWASWLVAYALGLPRPGLPFVFLYIGIFAPAFVAIWLTGKHEGRSGLTSLLARLFQWRVGWRWYAFALLYMVTIKLTAAVVQRIALGEWPKFGEQPLWVLFAATLASTLVLGQSGEEVGWRGYALPRLAERMGLPRAAIVLGAIWAVWHLPLFLFPGIETSGQSFPLYVMQVTALSVAIAWVYAGTKGSLLLTMLLHAAINNTKDIVPAATLPGQSHPFHLNASVTSWASVGVLWLAAAYFLPRMHRARARIGAAV